MSALSRVLVVSAVALAPLLSTAAGSAAAGGTPVTWTIQPPSAPYPTGYINGLSCASVSWCVAVGNTSTNTVEGPLAEVWNGKSWSVMTLPQPSASGAVFYSVSCLKAPAPSPSPYCMAAGNDYLADGDERPTAEVWNGTKWSVVTPITPATAYLTWFQSVNCTDRQFCMAVGQTRYGHTQKMLAELWNGSKWEQEAVAPIKNTYDTSLTSVSCLSDSFCNAVGAYSADGTDGEGAAEEIWNGKTWALAGYDDPNAAVGIQLWGIACAAVNYCVAAGYYWDSNSENAVDHPDLESWNGVTWTVLQKPNPPGASWAELETVTCVAVRSCVAAGEWARSTYGSASGYAETLTGDTATATSLPNPPNATFTSPNAVSCPAPGSCVADGSYYEGGGNQLGFAESEHSGVWSLGDLVNEPGIDGGNLNSVSCTSASACVSVGYYPFAESWNGKDWAVSRVPAPANSDDLRLESVSCAASDWCIGVGSFYGSGGTAPGSDVWNGKDWTVVNAPRPGGSGSSSQLNAVECKSVDYCVAVGSYYPSEESVAFGEVWNGKQWRTV
ncbi:MAG TPA: hypothetical protein VGP46_03455, partial [Acidimicrobiales bacterium]|nr:hypothetical protein [Acidimicrobiales bacterium]